MQLANAVWKKVNDASRTSSCEAMCWVGQTADLCKNRQQMTWKQFSKNSIFQGMHDKNLRDWFSFNLDQLTPVIFISTFVVGATHSHLWWCWKTDDTFVSLFNKEWHASCQCLLNKFILLEHTLIWHKPVSIAVNVTGNSHEYWQHPWGGQMHQPLSDPFHICLFLWEFHPTNNFLQRTWWLKASLWEWQILDKRWDCEFG